jgi:hypothetical protein
VTPYIVLDMTDGAYYADPCEVPSLSQSTAQTILDRSPAHAHLQHPRLGGKSRKRTRAMGMGAACHSILLGKGAEIRTIDADNYQKKAAQVERDEALGRGEIPLLLREYDEARECSEVVRDKLRRRGISLDGAPEASIFWEELTADGPIQCRGRMDLLRIGPHDAVIIDLKKASDAHPRELGKHMVEYGYDIQAVAYSRAVEACHPELAGRIRFINVFFEAEPPYPVTVAEPSGTMRELGEMRWERAGLIWSRCLRSGHWPDYSEEIERIDPPQWRVAREEFDHANV